MHHRAFNRAREDVMDDWDDGLTRANRAQGGEIRRAYKIWSQPMVEEMESIQATIEETARSYVKINNLMSRLRTCQKRLSAAQNEKIKSLQEELRTSGISDARTEELQKKLDECNEKNRYHEEQVRKLYADTQQLALKCEEEERQLQNDLRDGGGGSAPSPAPPPPAPRAAAAAPAPQSSDLETGGGGGGGTPPAAGVAPQEGSNTFSGLIRRVLGPATPAEQQQQQQPQQQPAAAAPPPPVAAARAAGMRVKFVDGFDPGTITLSNGRGDKDLKDLPLKLREAGTSGGVVDNTRWSLDYYDAGNTTRDGNADPKWKMLSRTKYYFESQIELVPEQVTTQFNGAAGRKPRRRRRPYAVDTGVDYSIGAEYGYGKRGSGRKGGSRRRQRAFDDGGVDYAMAGLSLNA